MRSVKMSELSCDVGSFLAQLLLCINEGKISFINKQYNFPVIHEKSQEISSSAEIREV